MNMPCIINISPQNNYPKLKNNSSTEKQHILTCKKLKPNECVSFLLEKQNKMIN